jgi:hypothetical protein
MDLKRKPALEGMSFMNVAFLYIFIRQGFENYVQRRPRVLWLLLPTTARLPKLEIMITSYCETLPCLYTNDCIIFFHRISKYHYIAPRLYIRILFLHS